MVGDDAAPQGGKFWMTQSASQRIAITGTTRLRGATSQRNQHSAHQGLNARRSFARIQLGGEICLLTFPLIEPEGGLVSLGPRTISSGHPLVNMADSQPINNDTGQLCKLSGAKRQVGH